MGISINSVRRQVRFWTVALAIGGLSLGTAHQQGLAVTFGGETHFAGVPRLVSATTTQDQARTWGGRYYFTVAVPEDSSEPLGQLVIQQDEGAARLSRFDLDDTVAFLAGDRNVRFAIESVEVSREERSITVLFESGIEPGQTVQLGLKPRRTPSAGVYLFGVTAFPQGESPSGQFLGYGRLHFYDNDRSVWWR